MMKVEKRCRYNKVSCLIESCCNFSDPVSCVGGMYVEIENMFSDDGEILRSFQDYSVVEKRRYCLGSIWGSLYSLSCFLLL